MAKTVRYCINCGREIGEALICPNPECGGLPSFYRDVVGPERPDAASQTEPLPRGPRETSPAPIGEMGSDRQTMVLGDVPVAMLRSIAGPRAEHPLKLGVTEIGARAPADLVIDRPEVSSRHARIECTTAGRGRYRFAVTDHGSTNGTFINDQKIQSAELSPGERIRFATVEFELCLRADDRPRVTVPI